MLDLEIILALMAWFAGGESKVDIPGFLLPEPDYSFSESYTHRNAARAEIFLANAGESTVWVQIRFLGVYGRELAVNEVEVHPLEFPYIYSGLDLVDRDGEEVTVQIGVDVNEGQAGVNTDIEVYMRQVDEDKELGDSFEPFSLCRRLVGLSEDATWSDC